MNKSRRLPVQLSVALAVLVLIAVAPLPKAIAGPATQIDLSVPDKNVTVGTSQAVSVTAKDGNGAQDSSYVGTVTFSASCGECFTVSPNNGNGATKAYTFVPGDGGLQTFTVVWNQVGTFSLTATGTLAGGGTAADTEGSINVTSTDAASFSMTVFDNYVLSDKDAEIGEDVDVFVTAKNAQGENAPYAGTVTFSASCGNCFTITPNNGGSATKSYTYSGQSFQPFTLKWVQAGTFSLTVTGTLPGGGTSSTTQGDQVVVDPNAPPTTTTTSTSTTSTTSTTTPTSTTSSTSSTTTSSSSTTSSTIASDSSTTSSSSTSTSTPTPSTTSTTATPTPTTMCGSPSLQVAPSSLTRGQSGTASGTCFAPNSSVRLELRSNPVVLGTAIAGANGSFTLAFVVPQTTPVGSHSIVAVGTTNSGAPAAPQVAVQVAANNQLPKTGGWTNREIRFGVAMLWVGLCLAVIGEDRRRRGAHFLK